jgi:ribosomal protein L4
MSQKINPIIYRLGTKTSWVSKYCEKKRHELKNLSFNELQLTKFIKLFFKKTGLQLKNCKIYYKKNSLHFFLIYDIIKLKLKNLILIKHKLSNELKFFKNLYKKNPVIFNIMQLKNIYKLKKKKLNKLQTLFKIFTFLFEKK